MDIQIITRDMKIYSTSLVRRKIKVKTTVRYTYSTDQKGKKEKYKESQKLIRMYSIWSSHKLLV